MVKLAKLLTLDAIPERINDTANETFVTVRSKCGGAVKRPIKDGKTPVAFTGYRIHAGQLIYSRIDARNNAFAIVPRELDGAVVSKDFPVFRIDESQIMPEYLMHFFRAGQLQRVIQKHSKGITNRQRIKEEELLAFPVPLPPLVTQRRIVAILDKADAIRAKRRQLLADYDELPRSLFLDMFGDPVDNPRRWDTVSMASLGSFKNGLNFGKGESGRLLKVVGVGDFGSRFSLDSFDDIAEIPLNQMPDADYMLKDGDILFVRSNGNKALVGRSLLVYPGNEKASYSGFCIRFRLNEDSAVAALYLNSVLQNRSVRQRVLGRGRGSNISNLNQKILQAVKVPLPPLHLQREFASRVEAIAAARARVEQALALDDELFASLQSRAFRGFL